MPKILLVEDNEMNREMLSRRLRDLGHSVVVAHDGEQGHSMAFTEQPDLIVIDIGLPGIDGLEVTRLLKSNEEMRHIPIIVLTGFPTNRESAFAAGCDDYVVKPVAFSELQKMIQNSISKRAARLSSI